MDAAGVAAVRAIHKKCAVGSVRDEASFRFLRSLGIRNIVLTGCPVLFHGLKCSRFQSIGRRLHPDASRSAFAHRSEVAGPPIWKF